MTTSDLMPHDWRSGLVASRLEMVCCAKCGIVQRKDGKNGPCKGEIKVTLRDKQVKDRT